MRAIGDICQDVIDQLRMEVEPGTERSAVKRARPSGPHSTGQEGGVLRSEKEVARASVRAELPPLWEEREFHGGVADMELATVRPKSERPRSAVVISMSAWKAERRVHVTPSPLRGRG